MKKSLFIFISIIFWTFHLFGQSEQEILKESKELGLVSYLTTVKSLAEFKMISLASHAEYEKQKDKAQQFNSEYNLLKLSVDRMINQLSADMSIKNNLKVLKKINGYTKGDIEKLPTKFLPYGKLLIDIDGKLETFMLKTYSSALAGPTLTELTGVVTLGHGIITDARDFREKKISNTIILIKDLKLSSLKDLTEKKEKKT